MIINYILTAVSLYKKNNDLREAATRALMIWALHIYVWVLILSAFNALSFPYLLCLYAASDIFMVIRLMKDDRCNSLKEFFSDISSYIRLQIAEIKKNKTDLALTAFIVLFTAGLGLVACFAVPYNYDSVDYHAPRICQWVQNRSVFYYASHVKRQNFSTVLASYIGTFAYILSGRRSGAMCIVQYMSYVVNMGLILYLCRRFGVCRRIRVLAAILWITLPIGFAEAITPQNDQVAATWLLVFVIELLDLIEKVDCRKQILSAGSIGKGKQINHTITGEVYCRIIFIAISIALGYLTKPSVCFAMLVFLCWYLGVCLKNKYPITFLIKQCIIAGAVILVLICPQMIQNYSTFGSLTADIVGKQQLIGTLRPNYLMVNAAKNLAFNTAFRAGTITNTDFIIWVLYKFANVLGVDINDPVISEGGIIFKYPSLPCYTCDAGLNNLLYLLTFISLIVFIYLYVRRRRIEVVDKAYVICTYTSYLLLCMFLRWETSVTRYMIGLLALFIVAVANICGKMFVAPVGTKVLKLFKSVLFIVFAMIIIIDISYELVDLVRLHPVYPVRSALTLYHDDIDDYAEACEYINGLGIDEIGLIESECPAEYAIWLMLDGDPYIRHVNLDPDDPLRSLEKTDIVPDVILSRKVDSESLECHGQSYVAALKNGCWSVYTPVNR